MPLYHSAVLAGKSIVVVEDEFAVRMAVQKICTRAGLVVVGLTGTAEEGIDLIASLKPDMVTMNIRLPGMDGIEATRRICAAFPTCILITSGFGQDLYEQAAYDAGALGYLIKPFGSAGLISALEACWWNWEERL